MKHSKANVFMVAILSVAFFLSLSVYSAYGQWAATYGGIVDDNVSFIQKTQDEGYIVMGDSSSFGAGSSDFWIMKLDSTGAIAWQKTYGGTILIMWRLVSRPKMADISWQGTLALSGWEVTMPGL
jgi:hypothetical protein